MKQIYHDPKDPGSLGGVDRLLRRAKQLHVPNATRQKIQKYLKSEQSYTLHKPARQRFTRNQIYEAEIDAQWQADLADMQGTARQNIGMRYLLTVKTVFSKFTWVVPVPSKDAKAITGAFKQVLTDATPRRPRRLQTDKGKEFFNSDFQALIKRHGIQLFAPESAQKAAVVERFNRTIKSSIWTYLSDRGSVRWINVIQDMVDAYNHSRHRSIGMTPAKVQKKDDNRLWVRLYGDGDTHLKIPILQGTMLRASRQTTIFDKGYMPNWTKEHYTVSQAVTPRRGTKRRVYKLVDYYDENVKGTWYPEEIQEISDNLCRIEQMFRKRTLPDNTKELFVRWEGWPVKYNSWIKETDKYDVIGEL